jgi:hypothetical protein
MAFNSSSTNEISPLMMETTTITAVGRVMIPNRGKMTVNPVMRPIEEKNSGSGIVRSSYSSILNLTSRRGCGTYEVVP